MESSSQDNINVEQARKQFEQLLVPDFLNTAQALSQAVDATTKEVPENFKCNICLMLVSNPEECGQCNQIFCRECIQGWKAKKGNCPLC